MSYQKDHEYQKGDLIQTATAIMGDLSVKYSQLLVRLFYISFIPDGTATRLSGVSIDLNLIHRDAGTENDFSDNSTIVEMFLKIAERYSNEELNRNPTTKRPYATNPLFEFTSSGSDRKLDLATFGAN